MHCRYRVADELGNENPNATSSGCLNPPNDGVLFTCGVPRDVLFDDSAPPVVNILPSSGTVHLEGGDHYVEQYATATDALEGEVTHKILKVRTLASAHFDEQDAHVNFYFDTQTIEVTDGSASARRGTCQNCYIPVYDTDCTGVPVEAQPYCETGAACLACGGSGNQPGALQVRACIRPSACVPFGSEMNVINTTVPSGMSWNVRYAAIDSSGNRGEAIRTVVVRDNTPPVVRLVGPEVVVVEGISHIPFTRSPLYCLTSDLV